MDGRLELQDFITSIEQIQNISDSLMDGWALQEKPGVENGKYLTKRHSTCLNAGDTNDILVTIEYHIAYNMCYGVPILCLKIWRQDGSLLSMEEYWTLNQDFKDSNMYDTLTQLDHPVLCQPFLTLHPCRTQEIIVPVLGHSKNPVISWLSVIAPFVHMPLPIQYLKYC